MKQKKVRRIFRSDSTLFTENEMKILFFIGMRKEDPILFQTDIAKALEKPLTSVNYQIQKLRSLGLITKKLELTNKGKKTIQYFKQWDKTLSKKLRAHKIQVRVKISKIPYNFFDIKHKILKPFSNQKYRGLKCQLLGSTVLFYSSRKLVVKIPDIFGNSNEEIMAAIDDCMQQIFTVLSQEFRGIVFDSYEVCKFDSMHVAILNSVIAETFLLKEGRCYHGGGGLCIDGSHGVPELECEELENISENIEVLMKYEDLAAENKRLQKLLQKQKKNNNG